MASSAIERHLETAREFRRVGNPSASAESYGKVLQKNPSHADALFELAQLEAAAGRYASAAELLKRAVAARDEWPEALNDLGIALHHLEEHAAAMDCLRRCVSLAPHRADYLNNLGNMLRQAGSREEAAATYTAAVALNANDPFIHYNLGLTRLENNEPRPAAVSFGKAISLKPDYAPAYHLLGASLIEMNRWEEAAAVLRKTVSLAPDFAEAHSLLGQALVTLQRREQAIASFQTALRLKPDDEAFRYQLAAQIGNDSVQSVPDRFVRSHFNDFAHKFDDWLMNDLKYKAPEDLLRAVNAIDQRNDLDILDLGCGTGLCGALFRPRARKLVGIDLAAKMLDRARQRNVYDELIEGNLMDALRGTVEQWDMILAGDVFIYVGDMCECVPACATALRPGGVLAFTLERTDERGFVLQPNGRFAHSARYIQDLIRRTALQEISIEEVSLREEAGVSVRGFTIVARKPF